MSYLESTDSKLKPCRWTVRFDVSFRLKRDLHLRLRQNDEGVWEATSEVGAVGTGSSPMGAVFALMNTIKDRMRTNMMKMIELGFTKGDLTEYFEVISEVKE